ncbi:hypothetical protein TI04_08615, partial [Achromatium sp. WMS2]
NALVIEEPADILNIKSDYISYTAGFNHIVLQNLRRRLTVGLGIEHRTHKTRLLDFPFSLGQGYLNGKSTVVPIRFSQEWLARDVDWTYNMNSMFSFGTNMLNATQTKTAVDTKFITWVLQQRYTQSWHNNRLQFLGRLSLQLADSPLPVLEQLGLGGISTVRGYRENTLVRDQAVLGSMEIRYGLLDPTMQTRYGRLYGAIFADYAHGWSKDIGPQPESLYSVGLGLIWSWQDQVQASIYWGHALHNPPQRDSSVWQDQGFHIQLQATY